MHACLCLCYKFGTLMSVSINGNWYLLEYNIQPIFLKQNEITVTMFQMNKKSIKTFKCYNNLKCVYIYRNIYRYIDIDKIEIAQRYHNFSHMYCVFCRILRASGVYRNCHGRDLMVN